MVDPVAPVVPEQAPFTPLTEQWTEGDHPTANPDGVTASNDDYSPKTQEEKAALLGVAFVGEAGLVTVAPEEPYPDGSPQVADEAARLAQLLRIHSPMELVEGKDMAEQQAKNLAAGGSVTQDDVLAQVTTDHGA